jgi:hypothetical protein
VRANLFVPPPFVNDFETIVFYLGALVLSRWLILVSVTVRRRFFSCQAEVRANTFVPPPFVNDLRVIVSPGGIGFIKMMGFRKTNACNSKNGGLSTCQALRENPCVPPVVNDLEMISLELEALIVF